jgi:hypothetical protein
MLVFLIPFTLLILSCSNSGTFTPGTPSGQVLEVSQGERLEERSENLTFIPASRSGDASPVNETNSAPFKISLVADVRAPYIPGRDDSLQATEVSFSRDRVFVGYNTQGDRQQGGLDAVSLSNVFKPRILSTLLFTAEDINSLSISPVEEGLSNTRLFFGGASRTLGQGFIASIDYNAGGNRLVPESIKKIAVPGFSVLSLEANYIVSNSTVQELLLVGTGDNGGFVTSKFPLTEAPTVVASRRDLKSSRLDWNHKTVYSNHFTTSSSVTNEMNPSESYSSGQGTKVGRGDMRQVSGSILATINTDSTMTFLCKQGLREISQINVYNNPLMQSTFPNTSQQDKTLSSSDLEFSLNGLLAIDNYLLAALGGAGIGVWKMNNMESCDDFSVNLVGRFPVPFVSTNSLHYKLIHDKNVLVSGSGRGGAKIFLIGDFNPCPTVTWESSTSCQGGPLNTNGRCTIKPSSQPSVNQSIYNFLCSSKQTQVSCTETSFDGGGECQWKPVN